MVVVLGKIALKRMVIILDGPPASRKTTLASRIIRKIGGCVVHYKGFGPANLIAKLILKINPCLIPPMYDERRGDPFLFLSTRYWSKLHIVIMLLECLYKIMQQITIALLILLKRVVVIDEYLVLRLANYINALKHNIIDLRDLSIVYQLDISLLEAIKRMAQVKYVYIEPRTKILLENWKKRGHKVPYDMNFLAIVKRSFKVVRKCVTKMDKDKISLIIIS